MMRAAMGNDWERLAPLVQRHFAFDERVHGMVLTGTMDVIHGGIGRLLFPLLGRLGVLVPYQGRDVPCIVRHNLQDGVMTWHREFRFPGRQPYRFVSSMALEEGGCRERVRFGLAILMEACCQNDALVLRDRRYHWEVGGRKVPLPLRHLLGALSVEERQEGDDLTVSMTLDHPWFGRLFVYRGRFRVQPADQS